MAGLVSNMGTDLGLPNYYPSMPHDWVSQYNVALDTFYLLQRPVLSRNKVISVVLNSLLLSTGFSTLRPL